MKVLLDECVDWRLLRDLDGHDVKTVRQLGRQHVKNGELLRIAATQFDAFVTVDSNLPHQQNAASFAITIIVLRSRTTRLRDLRELLPRLRAVLASARPGQFVILSWRDL